MTPAETPSSVLDCADRCWPSERERESERVRELLARGPIVILAAFICFRFLASVKIVVVTLRLLPLGLIGVIVVPVKGARFAPCRKGSPDVRFQLRSTSVPDAVIHVLLNVLA